MAKCPRDRLAFLASFYLEKLKKNVRKLEGPTGSPESQLQFRLSSIKNVILGRKYDLSLAFVSATRIRKLNKIYRGIDTPTDILSFPLSKKDGEIYICKSVAQTEAKKFGRSFDNFLLFLVIHGLTHLKGFDHSSTMERIEARYRKQFGV